MSGKKAKRKRLLAILDVGHGNSAIVIDDRGVIVIDTGLGTSLLEFLRNAKITQIDVVLVSHADSDHISGLVQLLASKAVTIKKIRLNTDSAKKSQMWDNLLYELNALDQAGKIDWDVSLTANSNEDYSQGKVTVEVLGPSKYLAAKGPGSTDDKGRKLTSNSVSCVFRLLQDRTPIAVFPGDLDEIGLDSLQSAPGKTPAAILVFPHHGGHSGSSDMGSFAKRVCEQFEPKVVIFSIGRGLHSTPLQDVVFAVRKQVQNVRIACTQLSEHCAAHDPQAHPYHLNTAHARGRDTGACCAGTLILDLDKLDELTPSLGDHGKFIDQAAPNGLCRKAVV